MSGFSAFRRSAQSLDTRTCAVIVAAYRAERWIEECLASWAAVRVPDGWRVDMRIGVDGCEGTARELDRLGQSYCYSEENVGPYLIRNALIESAPADAYAIFDADDRALPCYLELLLPLAGPDRVSAGGRYVIDEDGERAVRQRDNELQVRRHTNGVCVISSGAWAKIGAFAPWRIAADAEMHARLPHLGIEKRTTDEPVFERRVHTDMLTELPDTGRSSKARKDRKSIVRQITRGRKPALAHTPEYAVFA